jgi:hypothetical protein
MTSRGSKSGSVQLTSRRVLSIFCLVGTFSIFAMGAAIANALGDTTAPINGVTETGEAVTAPVEVPAAPTTPTLPVAPSPSPPVPSANPPSPTLPVKAPEPPSVAAPSVPKAPSIPSSGSSPHLPSTHLSEAATNGVSPSSGSSAIEALRQGVSSATGAPARRAQRAAVPGGGTGKGGTGNNGARPRSNPALAVAQMAPLRAFFVYVWPAVALTPWLASLPDKWTVAVARLLAASEIEGGGGGSSTLAGGFLGRAIGGPASSTPDPPSFTNWFGADPPLPAALIYVFLAAAFGVIWFVTSRELGLPIGRRRWR